MPPKKKIEDTPAPEPDGAVIAAEVPNAAEAAVAEAFDPEADVEFEFRGMKFVVKFETRASFRYAMAAASGMEIKIAYELLVRPNDETRVMALGKPGESYMSFAGELFEAYNKAAGSGNS